MVIQSSNQQIINHKNQQETMKKYMKLLACLLAGAFVLTACDDDDPVVHYREVAVSDGLFIVNEGSYFSQVNGSLDYLDYATGKVHRNVFSAANGRSLGGTPNNAVLCGSKLYIATQEENRVEVVDAKTMKAFEPISVTAPRELCTDGEAVYVSSYTGEVSKVDTLTLKVTAKSAKVGANLEGIACRQGYVYVCNAWENLGNYQYAYYTNLVKLSAQNLQKVKDVTVVANPNQLIASGDDLYLASWGDYSPSAPATIQHISLDDQVTMLALATYMALGKDKLYLISSSYDEQWNEVNTYQSYDLKTGETKTFVDGKDISSPCAIGVDPVTDDVFISSRQSFANPNDAYVNDGYVVRYRADGSKVGTYNCGVNPGTLVFVGHNERVAE